MNEFSSVAKSLAVKSLGLRDYPSVWQAMQDFTNQRTSGSLDQLWLVEHPPVFTQGQAGKSEHLLSVNDIPIVQSDRGGQVTYHGPGQLVAYPLLDLRRLKLGVRDLVTVLEQSLVALLQHYDINAYAKPDAPGVYIDDSKIASLGLRVRRGCSFHGLALNVDMDLSPFAQINPCGYAGMAMTDMTRQLGLAPSMEQVQSRWVDCFVQKLFDKTGIMLAAQNADPSTI
ncbi:lipoyl(octanoyl) transferase LipB [Gilvimarinus agarilyticus]|uniref:lipoyl(octanoyl) transferase LipB n=1 Tax=Gilvimarinus sp. 2_MG-2023 TaxID=3062666 RepID=UPI001C096294|nr:lipoyl(octanoyl) transferase LipB [Gilvimarinus sp. 2_MG-2023]MBU2887610.1 lipoyl(octanoyl) transferase LipB [Gilvimarinus agarilyticus]MDO6572261.1 lipoyl(octanoyl) transferase LipB [Gilvimarinus sp. 2_MG-2023]